MYDGENVLGGAIIERAGTAAMSRRPLPLAVA
jgi:hypothetical protein